MWHRMPMRRVAALALLLGGCAGAPSAAPRPRTVTIVAVSEVRGTPEPCGCQSDPLGDVARVATLARGGLLVDAGGLRYGEDPIPKEAEAQAELKAQFLEKAWRDAGALVGLGEEDLRFGAARLAGAERLVANASGYPFLTAHAVRDLDGVKIGVFGLVDPQRADRYPGLAVGDPVAAAKREVAALRGAGAKVVVALAHLPRSAARRLAAEVPGLSLVVAGDDTDDGGEPEQVGDAIVVQPAKEAQRAARVELHLDGDRVSTKLIENAAQREARRAKLEKKIADVEADIARLTSDGAADPAYLATKRRQRADLGAEREKLLAPAAPPAGAYATAELVPVRRKLARDPRLDAAMKQLDAAVGEANRKAGEAVPPPPAARGEPHYVGMDDCELCHDKAVAFWKKTVHAGAWDELVHVNKQWSFDCIKCHVTGYGQPGGTSMAHVDKLTAVQCEVCHGPGSAHSDAPKKVKLALPTESDCKQCHTPEHSDTFQFQPYLRDVVGEGHGAKRRAALGPGVTGHELRHAAEEKARAQ